MKTTPIGAPATSTAPMVNVALKNTLTRMVSERGRDIDSGVGVVDEMKFPHPLYSVLNP